MVLADERLEERAEKVWFFIFCFHFIVSNSFMACRGPEWIVNRRRPRKWKKRLQSHRSGRRRLKRARYDVLSSYLLFLSSSLRNVMLCPSSHQKYD